MIGSFKAHASAINGLSDKDVRLSKRLGLSTYNLRGFESGKIGPKDGNDYVGGLFLDFGNIWKVDYDSQIDDSNKIRSSAGINTSWLSPVGPMSFILSQNLSKASTDVTEGFNFRLGTTF